MQGCFLSGGGSFFIGKDSADSLLAYLGSEAKKPGTVVYTAAMVRHADDPLFLNDAVSCLAGSADSVRVSIAPVTAINVVHSRLDVTSQPQFRSDLLKRDVDYITIVGSETHGSVMHSAMSLSYLGYRVEVPSSLVFSRDRYLHDSSLSLLSLTCGVVIL